MTLSGLILLRAAPLLASTSSITMTICEEVYFRPFGTPQASLRPQANRLLRAHVNSFGPYSMALTASLYSLSIGTAIANLAFRDGSLSLSSSDVLGISTSGTQGTAAALYLASVVFNAMHFAFGPRDLALINVVMDETKVDTDKGKDNCTAMGDWVSLNVVRALVADLPGWVCSFAGFMMAFS